MVKQSLHICDAHKKQFINTFVKLQDRVLALLCKMDDLHSCDEMLQLFVGQDLHTTNTVAFSLKPHITRKLLTMMENCYTVNFHHTATVTTKGLLGNFQLICVNFLLQLKSLRNYNRFIPA